MKDFIYKLFSKNGDVSMMRFLSLISLMAAIALAYSGKLGYEVFLAASFSGKLFQKGIEAYNEK